MAKRTADITVEPVEEIYFNSKIVEVSHLGQYNCNQTNATL